MAGDYEVLHTAYERSLTGQTRRMLTGESKFFDAEDIEKAPDLNPFYDILASAISFSMPLDALTMGVGTRTGSLVSRGKFFKSIGKKKIGGLERYFQKRVNKKILNKDYRGHTL